MERHHISPFGYFAMTTSVFAVLAVAGCGGSSNNGGHSTSESTGQTLTGNLAVQAAVVSSYQAFQGGVNYPFAQVQATLPNGSAFKASLRAAIAAAVQKRAEAKGAQTAHTNLSVDDIGLYSTISTSGNTATLTAYSDEAETQSVGTLTVTQTAPSVTTINPGTYASYPVAFNIAANLTGGPLPCTGSGTIALNDAAGAGEIKGTFNLPATDVTANADLTLNDSGALGGGLTVTENGQTITLNNLSGTIDGNITGTVKVSPQNYTGTGTLSIANDTFSITLNTPTGTATGTIDSSNNLVISYPDGTTETIANPLSALPTTTITGSSGSGGGGNAGPLALDVAAYFPIQDFLPTVSNSVNGNVLINNSGQGVVLNSYTQIAFVPNVNALTASQTLVTVPNTSENASAKLVGLNNAGEFVANAGINSVYVWTSPTATPTVLSTTPLGPSDGGESATALSSSGEIVGTVDFDLCAWANAAAAPTVLLPLNDTLVTDAGYTLTEVGGNLQVSGPNGPDTVTLTGVGGQPITASYANGQATLGLAGMSGTYSATFTATQAGQEVATFPFTLTIGDLSGQATGVNANGVIVGSSINGQSLNQAGAPVYWTNASPHAQTLPEPTGSDADNFTTLGISNDGQIYGNTVSGHVYVWSSLTAQPTELPLLSGGSDGVASAINASGIIAGTCDDTQGGEHPVIWKNSQIIDLQPFGTPSITIGGTTYNTALLQATSISDNGIVVGFADLTPFAVRIQ
jgi:hypothetical protein